MGREDGGIALRAGEIIITTKNICLTKRCLPGGRPCLVVVRLSVGSYLLFLLESNVTTMRKNVLFTVNKMGGGIVV